MRALGNLMRMLFGGEPTATEAAQQRLAEMVAQRAASPPIVEYRKRHAAALKGVRHADPS